MSTNQAMSAKELQANPNPIGPKRLSKEKRKFVDCLLAAGGNLSKAASLMGYTKKNPGAWASRIWSSEGVKEASQAELWDAMRRGSGAAVKSLIKLAEEAESEHARITASKEILDRLGFNQQKDNTGQGTVAVTFNVGAGVQVQASSATQTVDSTAQELDVSGDIELNAGDMASDEAF
jgi:hypothetical protein